jgi:hypothetical protein
MPMSGNNESFCSPMISLFVRTANVYNRRIVALNHASQSRRNLAADFATGLAGNSKLNSMVLRDRATTHGTSMKLEVQMRPMELLKSGGSHE